MPIVMRQARQSIRSLGSSIDAFREIQAVVEALDDETHVRIAQAAPDKATFKRVRSLHRAARRADETGAADKGHAIHIVQGRFDPLPSQNERTLRGLAASQIQSRKKKLAGLRAATAPRPPVAKDFGPRIDPNPTMFRSRAGSSMRVLNPEHPAYRG